MANVSYGDMITELKGGSNGRVYQAGKFGYMQRKRVKPHNPQSPFQEATRMAIATLNQQWKTLTEPERLAWIAAATGNNTGSQQYVSRNFDASRYNGNIIADVNYTPVPDSPGDPGLNGSVSTPHVHLNITLMKGVVSLAVDWGDGNTATFPASSAFDISHNYTGSPAVDILLSISDSSFFWAIDSNGSGTLTDFNTGGGNLIALDLSAEKLTVSTVNSILSALDNFNRKFGTLDLSGQTPAAAPTGAGITAKNNLIAKGWSVSTD